MSVRIDKSMFEPTKRGSFYTVGPQEPDYYIVTMHGSGRNAESMEKHAVRLAGILPDAQVIVPNGYVDTYHPEHLSKLKAEKAGEKFCWDTCGVEELERRYKENWRKDNALYSITTQHTQDNKAIHLVGTSAGAFGALFDYVLNPSLYASLTLHGYYLENVLVDELIKKAEENPAILDSPIMISIAFWDPLLLTNLNEKFSNSVSKIPFPKMVTGFAGRFERRKEHEENIRKLEAAGFEIDENMPLMSSHFLSNEFLDSAACFINPAPPKEILFAPCDEDSTPPPP